MRDGNAMDEIGFVMIILGWDGDDFWMIGNGEGGEEGGKRGYVVFSLGN